MVKLKYALLRKDVPVCGEHVLIFVNVVACLHSNLDHIKGVKCAKGNDLCDDRSDHEFHGAFYVWI